MRKVKFVLLMLISCSGWAVIPVIDMRAVMSTFKNIQAIEKMKAAAHTDIERLRGEFNALNPLNFAKDDWLSRQWISGGWSTALSGQVSSVVASKINAFKQAHQDLYDFSENSSQEEQINPVLQTNAVLDSETTQEYDRLDSYVSQVNRLSNLIPAATSTKAALDINSKLLAELAYIGIESLRMQVLNNQASSQMTLHNLKTAAITNQLMGEAEDDSIQID